jgi:hypothetical protein
MKPNLHKTLLASAITAMIAMPALAADETSQAPGAMSSMSAESSNNPLYTQTPDELWRKDVFDMAGEKVGTIRTVVTSQDRSDAHAVITYGGIMGYGADEILVSLDELRIVNDRLQINDTREALHAREKYSAGAYLELEHGRPISEFSAFEPRME